MENQMRNQSRNRGPERDLILKDVEEDLPQDMSLDAFMEYCAESLPKVGDYLKRNWKPVALVGASSIAVSLGTMKLLEKRKNTRH